MYDGLDGMFRNIKLRGRQANCPVCGDNPSIKHLIDYEQFCGARASDKVGLVRMFQNINRLGRLPTVLCVVVLVIHQSSIPLIMSNYVVQELQIR